MLAGASEASNSGNLAEAEKNLRLATEYYPEAVEAWIGLGKVQERRRAWNDAYDTWDRLFQRTQDVSIQQQARSALQRINDERVIDGLVRAEQQSEAGNYASAIDLLLDTATFKPSDRMFDRVRNRYFELLARWSTREISTARATHGWKSVAVANFVGGSEMEGYSIRDRIYSDLAQVAPGDIKIVFLSENGVARLQRGDLDKLPEEDGLTIRQARADALVFGTLRPRLTCYVYDVTENQTRPVVDVTPLGAIPGFPSDTRAWTLLPAKRTTSRGLRVEVWTDRPSYTIHDEVVLHFRSNQDCYVALLDLQTGGGLHVLFPNAFQKNNFVRANAVYSIPEPQASFSINVSGPPGVEGVKAMATTDGFAIGSLAEDQAFLSARTPEEQVVLCQRIRSSLEDLETDKWDIAEWTFEIKQAQDAGSTQP